MNTKTDQQEQARDENRENFDHLQRAVDIVGGQSALARLIGAQQGHVWKWLNKTRRGAPAEYVLPICKATGGAVTPNELRPDLYPDPDWHCKTGGKPAGSVQAAA